MLNCNERYVLCLVMLFHVFWFVMLCDFSMCRVAVSCCVMCRGVVCCVVFVGGVGRWVVVCCVAMLCLMHGDLRCVLPSCFFLLRLCSVFLNKDFRTTAKTWFMSFGKSICEPIPLRYRTQRRFSSHQISRARWWIFNTEGTTCWLWLVLARPVVICVGQQGWLVVSNDLKSEGHQSTHGFGG